MSGHFHSRRNSARRCDWDVLNVLLTRGQKVTQKESRCLICHYQTSFHLLHITNHLHHPHCSSCGYRSALPSRVCLFLFSLFFSLLFPQLFYQTFSQVVPFNSPYVAILSDKSASAHGSHATAAPAHISNTRYQDAHTQPYEPK